MRKIKIIGEISYESYKEFSDQMDELEKSKKPIDIELCSGGGDGYAGLAFYSRIQHSPCMTRITVLGSALSAATIILAAGNVRQMHEDAWFMVHDEELKVKESNRKKANSEFEQHEAFELHWARILAQHSTLSSDHWRELSKNTTYMNPADCLAVGIIHSIIKASARVKF